MVRLKMEKGQENPLISGKMNRGAMAAPRFLRHTSYPTNSISAKK